MTIPLVFLALSLPQSDFPPISFTHLQLVGGVVEVKFVNMDKEERSAPGFDFDSMGKRMVFNEKVILDPAVLTGHVKVASAEAAFELVRLSTSLATHSLVPQGKRLYEIMPEEAISESYAYGDSWVLGLIQKKNLRYPGIARRKELQEAGIPAPTARSERGKFVIDRTLIELSFYTTGNCFSLRQVVGSAGVESSSKQAVPKELNARVKKLFGQRFRNAIPQGG